MSTSKTTNRRKFFKKGAVTAAAATAAALPVAAQAQAPVKQVVPGTAMYSSVVTYGNLVFLSGLGDTQGTRDIKGQTRWVLDEIKKRLEAAGSSMDKVLKASVFLADIKDFAAMNEVYQGSFGSQPPVRTTVSVTGIPGNALVEIDVVAHR